MTADNVGLLAMFSSLLISVVGLPLQIHKNYKRGNAEGLSLVLIGVTCWSYCIWAVYGYLKQDKFLLYAQSPGFVFGLILLAQIAYYRKG